MFRFWQRDEYSHSYVIPFVALGLIWQKLPHLGDKLIVPSWLGVAMVVAAIGLHLLGELSALYTIVNYAYVFTIIALIITALGLRSALILAAPLTYLLFMVPLPNFLYFNLSQYLQLVSSDIGVWVIRLFGISVFLEGNVIDLGSYKLQVVEACSGLRYLFPLASFGFLMAYLFQAPLWQRIIVFVSTLPITVLMNSFRIGIIGVLVEYWGGGMADGFLHYFEGWIIFIACLGLLFLEIWLLHRLSGYKDSVWNRIDLNFPQKNEVSLQFLPGLKATLPLLFASLLMASALVTSHSLADREETTPERTSFLQFPLSNNDWIGREVAIDSKVLSSLRLTDHINANYQHLSEPSNGTSSNSLPVNLYIAYYESQRKGASIHSPKSCMPGGGWVMESINQIDLSHAMSSGTGRKSLSVNRVLIQKGEQRQLVYYWFEQRGRVITNEYLVKWYLFVDSLLKNRTDGALVRIVTPIPEGITTESAEAKMQDFFNDFYPLLNRYLPE